MVIGFCGPIGAGKSTASKYLVEKYGFEQINFKDALLEEVKKNFSKTLESIKETINDEGYSKNVFEKPYHPIIRSLLQEHGTEVRRKDDPDYWIKKWVYSYRMSSKRVVVDDVRFPNEARALDGRGVLVLIEGTSPDEKTEHESEQHWKKFKYDFHIDNSLKDDTLFTQLDSIIRLL